MNKYDNMLAIKRERSREKITSAKIAIWELMEDGERISVLKLMKLTGLSRRFFYKNAEVRRELDDAVQQQAGTVNPRRKILDQAMDSRIKQLQHQLAQLQRENAELKKENAILHKVLGRKNVNLIKNLQAMCKSGGRNSKHICVLR